MDYETIDDYKLSRLDLFFNMLFRSRMFNKNQGQSLGIRELVTTLAVAGILFIVGVLIFGEVDTAITGTGAVSTANTTITGTILDGFELGVVTLIVLAAVVILGVLFALRGTGSSSDEDEDTEDETEDDQDKGRYTSMDKFRKKEDTYNKEYYKGEPDYDDAKKSFWDRFKRKEK